MGRNGTTNVGTGASRDEVEEEASRPSEVTDAVWSDGQAHAPADLQATATDKNTKREIAHGVAQQNPNRGYAANLHYAMPRVITSTANGNASVTNGAHGAELDGGGTAGDIATLRGPAVNIWPDNSATLVQEYLLEPRDADTANVAFVGHQRAGDPTYRGTQLRIDRGSVVECSNGIREEHAVDGLSVGDDHKVLFRVYHDAVNREDRWELFTPDNNVQSGTFSGFSGFHTSTACQEIARVEESGNGDMFRLHYAAHYITEGSL